MSTGRVIYDVLKETCLGDPLIHIEIETPETIHDLSPLPWPASPKAGAIVILSLASNTDAN